MRILHLSRTMDQGGAEKVVFQLAVESQRKGIFVAVASCGGAYVEELTQMEIPHYKVWDLECKKAGILMKTFKTLARIVRRERIDVLHTHHRMAAFYGWLLKLCYPKLRVIYTAHNVFYDKKFLTKLTISHGEIVAVGENVKQNLMDFFGVPERKISVIYNAVWEKETDIFDESLLKMFHKETDIVVGIIGRLSQQKGMDIYVRAMKQAHDRNPNIKGVIIGDGELRDEIRNLISDLEMQDVIYMIGYQSQVVEWIRRLDFVVMPSRWEGFPLTPIEVFMAGKTIIGSDIGGINEIIQDNVNGFLVEKDNVNSFAEKILELAGNDELRARLECAGQEYYNKHFDYNSFIGKYMFLYENVVGK